MRTSGAACELDGCLERIAKGGAKIIKEGDETHLKLPKRGIKVINEEVIRGRKGDNIIWEKYPVEK